MSCLITGSLIDKQKYMLLKLAGFADETDEHCSKLAAGMHSAYIVYTGLLAGGWVVSDSGCAHYITLFT